MVGTFILSLDCEGKWGVADHLNRKNQASLADVRLREAYGTIVKTLDRYDISATFAFVGLFAEPADRLFKLWPMLEDMKGASGDYLAPALHDMREGTRQGWTGDWAIEMVNSSRSNHEIGLHGVTHVPWTKVNDAFLDAEHRLFTQLSNPTRLSRSFIFPRNQVAHVDKLSAFGIEGYRASRRHSSRLASFLSEFSTLEEPETPLPDKDGLTVIPAGTFLNFRAGPRGFVPSSMTARRAAIKLQKAVESGGVVHYWLHPENVAAAPSTMIALERILSYVAALRDRGACRVLTQADYIDHITLSALPAI